MLTVICIIKGPRIASDRVIVTVAYDYTKKTHSSILSIFNVTKNSSGSYQCFLRANNRNFSQSIDMNVVAKQGAYSVPNNLLV